VIAIVGLHDTPSVKGAKKISPREMHQGERLFEDCLREAGFRDGDLKFLSIFQAVNGYVKPSVIVALGDDVAKALLPEYDLKAVDCRGYVFDSPFDCPVIVTVHPATVARTWVPWRVLLSFDLQRTKELHSEHLCRPSRQVELVTSPGDARDAVAQLRRYRWLASDIETWPDTSLACVGFAGHGGEAFVFPTRYLDYASELLRSPNVGHVWVNGIYDLFCLKYREGCDVRGRQDDAMIAWHACYPEIAGKKEDKKKHKMTRKGLAFLASLCTFDEWWKGDYETEEEFFIYNGKDNLITADVWMWVKKTLTELGAWPTYEHERLSMWPCVDMLERGLNVDNSLRLERIETLSSGFDEIFMEMNKVVLPLLERERERVDLRLFEVEDRTCECCGHGKKKQQACWGCAGFEKAPSKQDLIHAALTCNKVVHAMKKDELEDLFLGVCKVCSGLPRETRLIYNPRSGSQNRVLLYDILKLPKKTKDGGKLTTDEKALRKILGGIA